MHHHRPTIEPGIYRHFKGNEYEVIGVARHSENGEYLVMYTTRYETAEIKYGALCARPYEDFIGEAIVKEGPDKGKSVKRFTFLRPSDGNPTPPHTS